MLRERRRGSEPSASQSRTVELEFGGEPILAVPLVFSPATDIREAVRELVTFRGVVGDPTLRSR
jgi:hypothetical protein